MILANAAQLVVEDMLRTVTGSLVLDWQAQLAFAPTSHEPQAATPCGNCFHHHLLCCWALVWTVSSQPKASPAMERLGLHPTALLAWCLPFAT
eukprot:6015435-Amphidinium_carterae.1